MYRNRITVILFMLIFFYSCEKNPFQHIHCAGKFVTETRKVEGFKEIELSDDIDVKIIYDSLEAGTISLSGGENLLPFVQTEVKDSVLYISNNNRLRWTRNYEKSKISLTVTVDKLTHFIYRGVGNIEFLNTLLADEFLLECWDGMGTADIKIETKRLGITLHSGAPDIILSGIAQKAHYYSNSYGKINALDCWVDSLSVHSRATGSSYVNATQTIGATIEYFGNVYYINNPEILWKSEKSRGKLIKLE